MKKQGWPPVPLRKRCCIECFLLATSRHCAYFAIRKPGSFQVCFGRSMPGSCERTLQCCRLLTFVHAKCTFHASQADSSSSNRPFRGREWGLRVCDDLQYMTCAQLLPFWHINCTCCAQTSYRKASYQESLLHLSCWLAAGRRKCRS